MDRELLPIDAVPLSDLNEAEAAGQELDALVGGLGPVPGDPELIGDALAGDAFDANILAAMVAAR
jgi:hypothetical protein